MNKFIITPLEGIGKVKFGDSREQVNEAMGVPEITHERADFYVDGSLRIDYNEENQVEFIEFSNDENLEIEVYNINPFNIPAKDLVELLKQKNGDGIVDEHEAPFCYAFNDIVVGIYRDATEQDILVSIEEAKQDGTYEEDKEWLQEELEKYSHFQTIAFGKAGYYISQ